MDEKDWLILQTIHKERNITKAAEKLYISQPSLTYRIQQLEKEFAVKILSRRKRGVDFTSEGEYLVEYANRMVHQLREAKDFLSSMEGEVRGALRLGVSQTYARYRLPEILAAFLIQYPQVDLKLKTGFSYEVIQMVHKEEANIGIVRDPYDWKGPKILIDEERIFLASNEKIELEQLPYLPRIDYNTDPSLKSIIDLWWKENFDLPPAITMEVDIIDTCREMVLNGLGYGILPEICLKGCTDLNTWELSFKGEKLYRKTWLVFNESSLDLSVSKAFIEFIRGSKA
ncbi:DNA-binding transcriptional LysR family regulator [Cytobacillus firmus]|uniref:DNA-binding transcriptional LysR family regulator n=2 Tax=Cytobacillus TaxID=2675230 RepID=A0A366JYC5_CYTFI|nr:MULTISPECIES: LysR family transcriptional regulator [Cytobacillus]RBP94535.1 DNA-binding transcriptional LysR family regulator [Cytobacillus firmus]TDX43282.1 DNA-binding transcriptional LysR family regulator [Cytobacillus oceanisediminis]